MLEHEHDYLPIVQTPLINQDIEYHDLEHGSSQHSHGLKPSESPPSDPDTPKFRRFAQATNLELFYDLFFVANLAAFTYVHEINDSDTLKQYVGFFAIIWLTWYQVSLYDVRFAMDSLFERTCKAAQFLIMISFAVVGTKFNPGEEYNDDDDQTPNFTYFRGLTIILMLSRLVLAAEYLQALWFAKGYRKVVVPMLLIASTYFVAAMVYLGLFWTFDTKLGANHSYITWYVVAILETLLATSVSIIWRNLSFVETHLVERMSLLTLIILGEGAIGAAKSCQYIVQSEGVFHLSGSVGAYIACAVFNLYFMYMIYFDWLHEELFGTIRQQIWSFLHFPLHIAMVLAVEGMSQCITWNAAVQRANSFYAHEVSDWFDTVNSTTATFDDYNRIAVEVNNTAYEIISTQISVSSSWDSTLSGLAYLYQDFHAVVPTIQQGASNETSREAAGNAVLYISGALFKTIFKLGGFYAPETNTAYQQSIDYVQTPLDFTKNDRVYWQKNAVETYSEYTSVFGLTFVYLFVSMGLFVVLCTILAAFNRGRKTQLFWVRLIFIAAIGVGLALLSTIRTNHQLVNEYAASPWLLPTITLALFTIVVINSVKFSKPQRMQRANTEKNREK